MAPNSAYTNAPNNVNKPAITHTTDSHTGEPSCSAIDDGFIKTPEPIMLPIMMEADDQKPIFLARDDVAGILNEEDMKLCGTEKSYVRFIL